MREWLDLGAAMKRTLTLCVVALAACGQQPAADNKRAVEAVSAAPIAPAEIVVAARPTAPPPVEPVVCKEDADEAMQLRLRGDRRVAVDPQFGAMNSRMAQYNIANDDMFSLRNGLARYETAPPRPVSPPMLTIPGEPPPSLPATFVRPETAALITYVGAAESCAWVVTANGIEAYGRSSLGAAVARDVAAAMAALKVEGAAEARSPTRKIAQTSVAPAPPPAEALPLREALARLGETLTPGDTRQALTNFRNVIVVPSKEFLGFPFALTLTSAHDQPPTYLIDNAAFQVAPALTEIGIGPGLHSAQQNDLSGMTPQARRAALANAVIVGNPAFDDVEYKMIALPGAEQEARGVAAVLGVAPMTGGEASHDAVLARMKARPRYLHFATHGIADQVSAAKNASFVALAGGGRLNGADLRGFRLPDGAIVVLSACQSGLGVARDGGAIGLPRMFQLINAQIVVMSLWNVDDDATGFMMRTFAEQLEATGRPAAAHAAAVRETRKRFPNPAQWASFVVFGTGPF